MKTNIIKSILAGVFIGIGAFAYTKNLDCKYIGAALFSVGLILTFIFQANLFTGKIGYINKSNWKNIIVILITNIITICSIALIFRTSTELYENARKIMLVKLNTNKIIYFLSSVFCGIIIYLAVECYKSNKNLLITFLLVNVFILCGFEHCIANCFYLVLNPSIEGVILIIIAIIGNSLGSILMNFLIKGVKNENN